MLSAYCSQVLPVLLQQLPDFADLVVEKGEGFQVSFLTPAGWEFWLGTEDDDYLTVGLAEYRCHFGVYAGTTPAEDAVAAAAFIRALQQGEVVIAVWSAGQEYRGSYPVPPTEQPQQVTSGPKQTLTLKRWG